MATFFRWFNKRRLLSLVINVLLVGSLVLSSVQTASAQEGVEPTPTETPIETEVVTVEPTDEFPPELTEIPTEEPPLLETPTPEPSPTEIPPEEPLAMETTDFSWELWLEESGSVDSFNEKLDHVSARLTEVGIAFSSEELEERKQRLNLSGAGDLELIRQVIYEILLPDFNFLAGTGMINIKVDAIADAAITVNLESQPATGYLWGLNTPDTSAFTMIGEPTLTDRFEGPGTTALQSFVLQAYASGQSDLEMLYARSFAKSAPLTRYLSIALPDQVSLIDLSDPNPPTGGASEAFIDELMGQTETVQVEVDPASLPTSWDWRATNKVSPIRDQGSCGSCWAFGVTAVMESALRIKRNIETDLSEQFLVSCNVPEKNSMCGYGKYNCSYGGCEDAQQYHVNTVGEGQVVAGAVLESQFPYSGTDEVCPAGLEHNHQTTSWSFVSGSYTDPTITQIKNAIYTYGPVTTRVCVGSIFGSYTGGVFNTDEGSCTNHLVALVGWNDSDQTWILRNSWGSDWGEGGYMRIKWGISGVGRYASYVTMLQTLNPPVLISPAGEMDEVQPTYSWYAVSGATGYQLRVTNTFTNKVIIDQAVGTSDCSGGVCSIAPAVTLIGEYKYEVATVNSYGKGVFSASKYFWYPGAPANDLLSGARVMTLNTEYVQNTASATVTPEEPVNVCNGDDTGSVWYKFTAPATGVYVLSTYGSDYSPNLTVVRQVSSTSRTPVVCGETDKDSRFPRETTELAFNATAGFTYLIAVSDAVGGGSLSFKINRYICDSGRLCGVVVEGDGRVAHSSHIMIRRSDGSGHGWGFGFYNGLMIGELYYGGSGYYSVYINGKYSLMEKSSVYIPGYFAPSAVGLPEVKINLLDASGLEIIANEIRVSSSKQGLLNGSFVDVEKLYLPINDIGYNFLASDFSSNLFVLDTHKPVISSVSSQEITLDASSLPRDTISIAPDDLTDGYYLILRTPYYPFTANSVWVTGNALFTLASPIGERFFASLNPVINDKDNEREWYYNYELSDINIVGGKDYSIQFGGDLQVVPYSEADLYRLDEDPVYMYAGVSDTYGNQVTDISYYEYSTTLEYSPDSIKDFERKLPLGRMVPAGDEDGRMTYVFEPYDGAVASQNPSAYGLNFIKPAFQVTDPEGQPVELLNDPSWISSAAKIGLTNVSNPLGTWNVHVEVDAGPLGGIKTGNTTFDVYSINQHPLTNDLVSNPTILTLPASIVQDTLGSTLSATDPSLAGCLNMYWVDKPGGIASVWYKYIPTQDGVLSVDTLHSSFDAAVAIYLGTPSVSTRKACNDDRSLSPFFDTDSAVELQVQKGKIYYIEVVDTGMMGYKKEYYAGAFDPLPKVFTTESAGIEPASVVGGTLSLNARLTPCYSLNTSVSPALSGTLGITPPKNCLGSKYIDGTEITLSVIPKSNYGLWKWSDDATDNPYIFSISENKTLQALLVAVPGKPLQSSPASGSLTYADAPVTLKWLATSPVSDHYEIMVARDSSFTLDVQNLTSATNSVEVGSLSTNATYYWRVRGISKIDQIGPWSAVRTFRTAVDAPSLFEPMREEMLDTNRPYFEWSGMSSATGYTIQIAKNMTFSSLLVSASSVKSYYTPSVNLPANIPLYWRVQVKAVNGPSRWSEVRSFTAPVAPSIPALLSPGNGALTTDYMPLLNWTDSIVQAGAPALANYQLQVASDVEFGILIQDITVDPVSQFKLDENLDPNRTYYWRVRAIDAAGNMSGWSAIRKLRTAVLPPVLLDPSMSEITNTNRPEFKWESINGATGYSIQISRNSTFTLLVSTGSSTTTSFIPSVNMPANVRLFWRVRAKAVNGPSLWSEIRYFTAPITPSIPALVSPANGALTTDYSPRLDWIDSKVSAGAPVLANYWLQIARDIYFGDVIREFYLDPVSEYEIEGNLAPNVAHYWRVRAIDDEGNMSGWSAARKLRTAMLPPVLVSPVNEEALLNLRPGFTWEPVAGATSYTLQISRYANFILLVRSVTVNGSLTTVQSTANLPAKVKLYWRVRANGPNGPSLWSEVRTMNMPNPPSTPLLISPANLATVSILKPRLDWSNSTVPIGTTFDYYGVQVATDKQFTTVVKQQLIYGLLNSEYTLEVDLMPATTYYWRVSAYNDQHEYSAWSAVRSFKTK